MDFGKALQNLQIRSSHFAYKYFKRFDDKNKCYNNFLFKFPLLYDKVAPSNRYKIILGHTEALAVGLATVSELWRSGTNNW